MREKGVMSANEETPLIQVVHVAPPRSRYSHHYVRYHERIIMSNKLI